MAVFVQDGGVQLRFNNAIKLQTNLYGATVTGTINADSATIAGGLFQVGGPSADSALTFTQTSGAAVIKNGGKGHLFIENGANNVTPGSTTNIYFRAKSGENSIIAQGDGSVFLYYNNGLKAQTVSGGFSITGVATATTFSGSGSSLTSLPAAQLTGTIDSARIPVLAAADVNGGFTTGKAIAMAIVFG